MVEGPEGRREDKVINIADAGDTDACNDIEELSIGPVHPSTTVDVKLLDQCLHLQDGKDSRTN